MKANCDPPERHLLSVTGRLVVALGIWTMLAGPALLAAEPFSVSTASQPIHWTISYQGKTVLVYASDPQKFKPYVQALHTLQGYGVLRDAPFDHLHHHALMYGIRVNGVNFWEEVSGCGVQKPIDCPPPQIDMTPEGLPRARIAQTILWLAPQDAFLPNTNAPALLVERRTLTLTLNPAARETALHWNSRFAVGSKTNQVVLQGANYHGLGVRFLQKLDPFAVHITPEGTIDLPGSKQDVSAHAWEAVSFDIPGEPVTLAVFGAPGNARGASRYFAMKTPFAYLAATQGLDLEPLVYRQGDQFELNYLVTLYPELKTGEALSQRAHQWIPNRD